MWRLRHRSIVLFADVLKWREHVVVFSLQVTELFADSKARLEQCTADLDEKQQRCRAVVNVWD